jgi:hypothetical protein
VLDADRRAVAAAQPAQMSDDLCFLSAVELQSRIARRELSPVEVARVVLLATA